MCVLLFLAALGGLLGSSWGHLGGLLGPPGRLLEASWGLLGVSWGPLGSLLGRHAKIIKKSMPKMTDLSSQKGAKMTPKSIQKAIENRCKDEMQKKHE